MELFQVKKIDQYLFQPVLRGQKRVLTTGMTHFWTSLRNSFKEKLKIICIIPVCCTYGLEFVGSKYRAAIGVASFVMWDTGYGLLSARFEIFKNQVTTTVTISSNYAV